MDHIREPLGAWKCIEGSRARRRFEVSSSSLPHLSRPLSSSLLPFSPAARTYPGIFLAPSETFSYRAHLISRHQPLQQNREKRRKPPSTGRSKERTGAFKQQSPLPSLFASFLWKLDSFTISELRSIHQNLRLINRVLELFILGRNKESHLRPKVSSVVFPLFPPVRPLPLTFSAFPLPSSSSMYST